MTLQSVWCVFTVVAVVYILLVGADAKYKFGCAQGEFENSMGCQKCHNNTYWVMRLDANDTLIGVVCDPCPPWFESPEGSPDVTKCVCKDQRCQAKESSMGLIIGVLVTVLVLGGVIAVLFWCKTYGPELLKHIRGQHMIEAQLENDEDDTLLQDRTPSPNLCDIHIDITDEQLDDGYNDATVKGDHNDMDAVLRAAVISEKRRSRNYSMSSMTDLDRHRQGSTNSVSGRSYTGAGYEKAESYNREAHLPLPDYRDYARNAHNAQTVL